MSINIYICVYGCINKYTNTCLLHEPELLALGLVDAHVDVEVLLQPDFTVFVLCVVLWWVGG